MRRYIILLFFLLSSLGYKAYSQCTGTPIINFSITNKVDVSCFAGLDGELEITLEGGEAPFTYSLVIESGSGDIPIASIPNTSLQTVTFNGLFANASIGTYKITVITSNGTTNGVPPLNVCSRRIITGIDITQPDELKTSATLTDACGGNDGQILLNTIGGTPAYSYAWTGPTVIGNINNPSGLLPGTYDVTITDTKGCSISESYVIDGPPNASITAAGPFCTFDAPTNLTAATPGGTWSGTGITDGATGTFDPATAGAGTHTITYTVTVLGCTSSATTTIVVNPAPDATITAAGPFCISDAAVNLTAATAGGTWSGTGITDGAAGTFDPATAGAGSHTITYTVSALGCTSSATTTIVVYPLPDATITAAGPFCFSDAAVNLTAATPGGTWSGTGITDGAAGTFDPATAGVGSHTITYTISVLGCTSSATATIVVNPLPDATITAAGPFCEYDAATNLTATTTGGTWSGTGITDGALGTFDPATAGPGSHTITYTVTVLGCTSSATTTIVVNPAPDATITAAGPFCISDAATNLTAATAGGTWSGIGITDGALGTFDPTTAGAGSHTITYTVSALGCTSSATTTIVVNPLPDATITASGPFCAFDAPTNLTAATPGGIWSGTGITDGAAGTFDPATAGAGTHTISYTVTVLGCTSSATTTIVVNPAPDATITAAGPFCISDAAVNLTAATAGGTWSGTGITDGAAGTFDPATAGAGSHTITYTITALGCTSSATTTIVVNPLPDATITAAGPFCFSDAAVNLTAATPGGTWSGTGITDGATGTFDPATAGVGSHTITYTVTVLGCASSATTTIIVNPLPDATITAAGPFCAYDAAINLTAVTVGGTWSGTGITNGTAGTFDPATAGPGSHTITYNVTTSGCSSLATTTIVVNPAPNPTITPAGPFCIADGSSNLIAATAGGTWSGIGITDITAGTFDPATAGIGDHAITYTVSGSGCTSVATTTITVAPAPDATIVSAGPFCESAAPTNLTANTSGGTWSGNGITDPAAGTFNPATAGVGSHSITYTITIGSCSASSSSTIVVNPAPIAPTASNDGPVCENGDVQLSTPSLVGVTYSWSGPNLFSSNAREPMINGIALTDAGDYSVTINNGTCTSLPGMTTVVVNPKPAALTFTQGEINPACQAVGQVYTVNGPATSSYLWTVPVGATIVGPANGPSIVVDFGVFSGNVSVIESSNGCAGDQLQLNINLQSCPLTAGFTADLSELCVGSTVTFTDISAGASGATYAWDFGVDATPATSNIAGPHSVAYATPGLKTITLTITNGVETSSDTQTINVVDPPSALLTGGENICPGSSSALTVNLTGTAPWTFTYNDGTTDITESINSSPYVFSVNPTVTTTYTAVSISDQLCSANASGSATIDVSPVKNMTLVLDSIIGNPGQTVNVPFSTIGFQDMLSMQFTVVWDPNLLSFNSLQNINVSQDNLDYNFNNTEGYFTVSWYNQSVTDTTIVDGDDLFSLSFNIANTICSNAPLGIDGSRTPIEVSYGNGCIANVTTNTGNIEIQGSANISSSDADNIICFGDQVTFTAFPGGLDNYQFYVNGVLAQSGASNMYVNTSLVDQDSVNVIVSNALACTLTAQGIITSVNQLTVNPTITDITGCGLSDGQIDLSVIGGSGTYTYSWTGPGIIDQTTQNQTNLGRGFYTVTVTDAVSNCATLVNIELKEPVNFTLSATKVDVNSTGGNNGSIDLTIGGGGIGPYNISWVGPGLFASTTEDISGLFAGTYTATVMDMGSGCTDAIVIEILQPINALVLDATKTDVTTCSAKDGSINLSITGGSGSYSISWIGPNNYSANSQNISGLAGGLYIATVRDLVTLITAQWTVQVDEPQGFSIVANTTPITYCSGTDGTITLTLTGGSGNFSYLWKDLDGLGFTATDKDIINLAVADYRVIVTDVVSGCVDSLDATIGKPSICDQPCALYVVSTTNNTSCPNTDDGVAVINIISGGSGMGNYYVSVDTGKTFVPFQGQDITAIVGNGLGSYLYIAKDTVTGCKDTTIANIGVSTNLMSNISTTNPGCAENDGLITFNVSGGVVPFTVEIIDSTGVVTTKSGNGFFQFTDLTAGSYFYSVKEQSGCIIVASDSIELEVVCESGCTSLIASASEFQDATCGTNPNGMARITVTGGSSPYEYTVDGTNWIPFVSGNFIDQLPPNGTYNIAIRQDAENATCRTSVSVTIGGEAPLVQLTPILTTQKASCNLNDGAVKVGKIEGGVKPYRYKLDDVFFLLPSDSIITEIGGGFHVFSVVDALDCRADFNFEVASPGVIVATATDVPVHCDETIILKAGIRIQVDLSLTTLPGPYEAYIASTNAPDDGIIYQIPDNGVRTILNLDKDFYNVTVSSTGITGACNFSESIPVFSGASPIDFDIIESDSIVSCVGSTGSITIANVTGDTNYPYIVQLLNNSGTVLNSYNLNSFDLEGGYTIDQTNSDNLGAGKYYIKIIQNQEEECVVSAQSDLITIYEPLGQLGFEVLEDEVSISDRPTGSLIGQVLPSGGQPYEAIIQLIEPVFEMNITDIFAFNESKTWQTASSTGNNLNRFPVKFDSLWAGNYEIFVRDGYGCEIRLEYSIGYDATVFIPNVFTPNNDGFNDVFYIRNLPETGTKVVISNRNGSVIYQSDNYNYDDLWDGGNEADGIYFYKISMPNGDSYKGWVEKWAGAKP